jgi:hypothetical protein
VGAGDKEEEAAAGAGDKEEEAAAASERTERMGTRRGEHLYVLDARFSRGPGWAAGPRTKNGSREFIHLNPLDF